MSASRKRSARLTLAMERARRASPTLSDAERKIVDQANAEARHGRTLDGTLVQLPAEPGKTSFSVEFEGASLNWNLSLDEIREAVSMAEGVLASAPAAERRVLARETVAVALAASEHVRKGKAPAIAFLTVWLMADRPDLREFLYAGRLRHAGYVISRLPGDQGLNFRFIGGG